ncbi:myosin heavy chain, skeletal muscle, adult [Echria macrotheca]|uniref:Myosin heavy chain, skeletal muscle, adult n=1 Tax=Echria macrotheca TaxID=438768 RepID=A0AAJ0F742_9PEZI|nr:myosin heavy chain, skeletal muscle, adult [Echria macrotheca]
MSGNSNQPIALRRSRRSNVALRSDNGGVCEDAPAISSSVTATPSRKTRPKKRVRFSDPGPVPATLEDELSTGLTPMIRRTSLGRGPRRHSTPAQLSRVHPRDEDAQDPLSPFDEIRFLPLRQVLDGRIKRRIRRNGLSEEMNTILSERKRRARERKEEIARLKAELAQKDDEICRLHDETVVLDTDRVHELEQQVELLKRQLSAHSGVQQATPSSPAFEWTMAARDPFSDDFMDLDADDDNDVFGETTMADLACSTPSRRARASFPTPPTTSPAAMPETPSLRAFRPPPTPCSHAGVQASLPDPEKQALEDELASLQLETSKLTASLESYSALTSRLSQKLSPYPPLEVADQTSTQSDVEKRLGKVLQMLSDRTAALLELNKSLSGLGFAGSDASEIITSLSSSFRAARLELEYLTPGEIPLPLTSAGAAVLDLILERLRDLSRKSLEDDDTIDEYHAIELSLRQQLGARVDAMDILNKEVSRMEAEGKEKDGRISELEVGIERLKGAVQRYARDVSELESLVQRMEQELDGERTQGKAAKEEVVRQHADAMADKARTISELESKLSSAVEQTTSLQSQLVDMQAAHAQALSDLRAGHKAEASRLSKAQGQALALRDARVTELRLEIDRVNESLRTAHETIRQLRVENGRLAADNDKLTSENVELASKREVDKHKAKEVIDSMKAELERVVRMSEGFLVATPKKPRVSEGSRRDSGLGSAEVTVVAAPEGLKAGGLLSGDLAKKGKKRRRYDSGLGFLD